MATGRSTVGASRSQGAGRRGSAGVYELLKEQILTGELTAGATLTETALATAAGVSRTPVREALKRLEQDGLVERAEHGGLRVRTRSVEEILEIYDVRGVLEAEAAREAAERHGRGDLLLLTELVDWMDEIPRGSAEDLAKANVDFHRAIWNASHNATLVDLLERLYLHLRRYPDTTYQQAGRWESAQREHHAIVEAIRRRDGDSAARLVAEHIATARDIRIERWRKNVRMYDSADPYDSVDPSASRSD